LLAAAPGARAQTSGPARWQLDVAGLLYAERNQANVFEPQGRITRLFANGQSLSATLSFDAITGASPTGAIPTTTVQTTTSPSGNTQTTSVDTVPTNSFKDARGALDLAWQKPFGRFVTTSVGTHFSREKDYRSLGASGKLSLQMMHRLTTITVGGGYNSDRVFPSGGTRVPLSDGTTFTGTDSNPKDVGTVLVGVSRILTRRWMVALDATQTREHGYLTEPYKVISLVDPETGDPTGVLTEKRPGKRRRRDLLASSVYHFETDVLYASDRFYWDDWGIRSNTMDVRYRHELTRHRYIEPHVRYYIQSRANFFRYHIPNGASLPEFASADSRLGPRQSATVGGTFGFRLRNRPGEWAIRAEGIVQWGIAHPREAIGNQRFTNLSPPVGIGSVTALYTLKF